MGFIILYGTVFRDVHEMPDSWTPKGSKDPAGTLLNNAHSFMFKIPLSISGNAICAACSGIFSSSFHTLNKPFRQNFTFMHFSPKHSDQSVPWESQRAVKLMSGFSPFENRPSGGGSLWKLLFIPAGFLKVTLFTDPCLL